MEKPPETDLRATIGFCSKEKWCRSTAVFTSDSLMIAGHSVMNHWQTGYMKALAEIASYRGGRILEVGYGLGIASEFIQMNADVEEHVIIECHPEVTQNCRGRYRRQIAQGIMVIHEDCWEKVTPRFPNNSFDGILFDTYPLSKKEIHKNHFFFFSEAYRLLKPEGIFSYYSDETEDFSKEHLAKLHEAGFRNISGKIVKVNPSKECLYWEHNTILAPIITK